jgi:hypothetical protein
MSVDPASIPQRVVDAYELALQSGGEPGEVIAAALDALMDHESVAVRRLTSVGESHVLVRPSDVLAAVLTREATA